MLHSKLLHLFVWLLAARHPSLEKLHTKYLPSVNLTARTWKMDGWNNFYVGWPIFRGYVSFRERIRSLQTKNNLRFKVGDVYCILHQDIMLFILFEQKSNIFRCFYHLICQWQVACGRSYPGSRGYPWNLLLCSSMSILQLLFSLKFTLETPNI